MHHTAFVFSSAVTGLVVYLRTKRQAKPTVKRTETTTKPDIATTLRGYAISPEHGFLGDETPLARLPHNDPSCQQWEDVAHQLPDLLAVGAADQHIAKLPPLNIDVLMGDEQAMWRAYSLLAMVTMAYVWNDELHPNTTLPANVAIPFFRIAQLLDMPLIVNHNVLVLRNFRLLDPTGPMTCDNLGTINKFLGGMDENWFYLVTVGIEAAGGPALCAITEMKQVFDAKAVNHVTADQALGLLDAVLASISEMTMILKRMKERCDPAIFFKRVRPFVSGWKNNPVLPDGIVYQGACDTPLQFNGGSAAQSSLVAVIDVAFGIEHQHPNNREFLLDMRNYMPPNHRNFVAYIGANGFTIPDFVCGLALDGEALQTVKARMNACVKALYQFRKVHMGIVSKYILQQLPSYKAHKQREAKEQGDLDDIEQVTKEEAKGTGGTGVLDFLRPTLLDTKQALVE